MEEFPTEEFDAIICGTGLKECIISGLLSKAGKKVLNLDRNGYYGGESASLNLAQMVENYSSEEKWDDKTSKIGKSRDFNIDLCPKLIMGSGELVSMLLHTGVTRYLNFKQIEGSFCYHSKKLYEVPVTAGAALMSSLIGAMQKLRAPVFFKWLAQFKPEDPKTYEKYKPGMTMTEIFKQWSINDDVITFCGHCIALYTDDSYLKDANETLPCLARMQLYAESLLKYGKSPYIYPQYGLSGLPEGFSRLSAVFGGVFMLRVGVKQFIFGDDGRVCAVETLSADGKTNTAKLAKGGIVVADPSYFIDTLGSPKPRIKPCGKVARWYCILKGCPASMGAEKGSAQIVLPSKLIKRPSDLYISVTSYKLDTCPQGIWLATISGNVFTKEPKKEMMVAYQLLNNVEKEFFVVTDRYDRINDPMKEGIFITSSMDATSHFQSATMEVKKIYKQITGNDVDLSKKVDATEEKE